MNMFFRSNCFGVEPQLVQILPKLNTQYQKKTFSPKPTLLIKNVANLFIGWSCYIGLTI